MNYNSPAGEAAPQSKGTGTVDELEQHVSGTLLRGIAFIVRLIAAYGKPVVPVAVMKPELAAQIGKPEIGGIRRAEVFQNGPVASGVFFFREHATPSGGGNFPDSELFGQRQLILAAPAGESQKPPAIHQAGKLRFRRVKV